MIFNFDKVQKDFLSAALKATKKNSACGWFTAHSEGQKVTYISDGHFFARVPDEMCFVRSSDRMRQIKAETFESYDLPKTYDDEYRLTDTMTSRTVTGIKDPVHIFTTQDGQEVWINEKLLAYFKDMQTVRFYQKNGFRNAVAVYVTDWLAGVLLPINHK